MKNLKTIACTLLALSIIGGCSQKDRSFVKPKRNVITADTIRTKIKALDSELESVGVTCTLVDQENGVIAQNTSYLGYDFYTEANEKIITTVLSKYEKNLQNSVAVKELAEQEITEYQAQADCVDNVLKKLVFRNIKNALDISREDATLAGVHFSEIKSYNNGTKFKITNTNAHFDPLPSVTTSNIAEAARFYVAAAKKAIDNENFTEEEKIEIEATAVCLEGVLELIEFEANIKK